LDETTDVSIYVNCIVLPPPDLSIISEFIWNYGKGNTVEPVFRLGFPLLIARLDGNPNRDKKLLFGVHESRTGMAKTSTSDTILS